MRFKDSREFKDLSSKSLVIEEDGVEDWLREEFSGFFKVKSSLGSVG